MRDLGLSYEAALHGVQSAVKYEMEHDAHGSTRPLLDDLKHLRVGIDARASDAAGLGGLLIKKGIITLEEYNEAMRLAMNEELARYEEHVRRRFALPEGVMFR